MRNLKSYVDVYDVKCIMFLLRVKTGFLQNGKRLDLHRSLMISWKCMAK